MSTAISLWLVIGGAVAAYAGWASVAVAAGANPWAYVAGAVVIYAGILAAITATWFALAWAFRAPRPQRAQIGIAASVRLFGNEVLVKGKIIETRLLDLTIYIENVHFGYQHHVVVDQRNVGLDIAITYQIEQIDPLPVGLTILIAHQETVIGGLIGRTPRFGE